MVMPMPDDYSIDGNKVYFGTFDLGKNNPDNVELQELGEPVSMSLDGNSDEHEDIAKILSEPMEYSFVLKMPWYMTNEWYKIFTGKLRFDVRSLNRYKSYRGKWHRGGKGRV